MFPPKMPHLAAAAGLLLAACAVPGPPPGSADQDAIQEAALADARREQPSTLYARDGSVVQSDRSGPIAMAAPTGESAPLHDIQRTGEGRMYILELYQNVIDERDALTLEVTGTHNELNRTRTALMEADARIMALEERVTALTARSESLEVENMELAGRLTTAQIRRLQAEKILLEIRLEESLELDALAEIEAALPEEL